MSDVFGNLHSTESCRRKRNFLSMEFGSVVLRVQTCFKSAPFMGVEVNIWRARIGAYARKKCRASIKNKKSDEDIIKPKCQLETTLIIPV